MAAETTNYGLKKPEGNEYYDIGIPNGNMDIIDTELKKAQGHRENTSNPHGVTAAQVGAINPNQLINNDFRVNQRGISVYNTNGYTFDRWKLYQNIANVVTIERVAITQTVGRFAAVIVVKNPANIIDYFQPIEDDFQTGYSSLAGNTITFSASIDTNSNWGGIEIGYTAGDGVAHERSIPAINGRCSVSLYIPAQAHGVYCGIGNQRALVSDDVNTYFNFFDTKLEIGAVPTPFSPRPYAEELEMCKRYFRNIGSTYANSTPYAGVITNTQFDFNIPSPPMRTIPSVSVSNYGNVYYGGNNTFVIPTALTIIGQNSSGLRGRITAQTVNGTYIGVADSLQATLDAEIY